MKKISEKTLKVILVSFEYPPRRLSKTSDVVKKLAKYLAKKNFDVWVVTFDDWRSDIELDNSITIIRIPNHIPDTLSDLSTIMNLKAAYQSAIATIIHEVTIDIIHFFEWQTIPLVIPWSKKLSQKLVYSTSCQPSKYEADSRSILDGIKKIEELAILTFDSILAENKRVASELIDGYNVESEKIKLIPFKGSKITEKILEVYNQLVYNK